MYGGNNIENITRAYLAITNTSRRAGRMNRLYLIVQKVRTMCSKQWKLSLVHDGLLLFLLCCRGNLQCVDEGLNRSLGLMNLISGTQERKRQDRNKIKCI